MQLKPYTLILIFMILTVNIFPQENLPNDLPAKASLSADGLSMIIGGKNYRIYNSFDPIAPRGGEHVVNFAGALNYYMWIFNTANGFSMAKIDMKLNIFYYDKKSNKFISPGGLIFIDEDNGNP